VIYLRYLSIHQEQDLRIRPAAKNVQHAYLGNKLYNLSQAHQLESSKIELEFQGQEISYQDQKYQWIILSAVSKEDYSQGMIKGVTENKYIGGCIFVDHASSYIHVEQPISLSSHKTLRAKLAFENMCRDVGVVVLKYMSDNRTAFKSHNYSNHLAEFHQVSKFADVGAYHHNTQAKRAIQTIMPIA
jgi:hypothetical protein